MAAIHTSGQNVTYPPLGQPPPYEAAPMQSMQTQPVIIQPGVGHGVITSVVVNPVGSMPSTITCKACRTEIITKVQFRPSMRTHLMALLFCAIGCWPCACVPYCIDSCNNVDHYCPNCNSFVGTYQN